MKANELIELLKDYPDFEITASFLVPDGSFYGVSLVKHKLEGINDIGYSDKSILLEFTEIEN